MLKNILPFPGFDPASSHGQIVNKEISKIAQKYLSAETIIVQKSINQIFA